MAVSYYLEKPEGLLVTLHARPRSSREGLELGNDGTLKGRVAAPPVDGAANAALAALIARVLGVGKSHVRLVSGEKSPRKTFLVNGDAAVLAAKLRAAVSASL